VRISHNKVAVLSSSGLYGSIRLRGEGENAGTEDREVDVKQVGE
jgi:hypothetical protein